MRRGRQQVQIAQELFAADAKRVDIAHDVPGSAVVVQLHLKPAAVLFRRGLHLFQRLLVDHDAVPERGTLGDKGNAANNSALGVNDAGGSL